MEDKVKVFAIEEGGFEELFEELADVTTSREGGMFVTEGRHPDLGSVVIVQNEWESRWLVIANDGPKDRRRQFRVIEGGVR